MLYFQIKMNSKRNRLPFWIEPFWLPTPLLTVGIGFGLVGGNVICSGFSTTVVEPTDSWQKRIKMCRKKTLSTKKKFIYRLVAWLTVRSVLATNWPMATVAETATGVVDVELLWCSNEGTEPKQQHFDCQQRLECEQQLPNLDRVENQKQI